MTTLVRMLQSMTSFGNVKLGRPEGVYIHIVLVGRWAWEIDGKGGGALVVGVVGIGGENGSGIPGCWSLEFPG